MWLSPDKVTTQVKRMLAKLGVRDRTQAVVWAYRTGLVGPSARDRPAPLQVWWPHDGPTAPALIEELTSAPSRYWLM